MGREQVPRINHDYIDKVKVYTQNLQFGMYVFELDRPWWESPFKVHGFELKTSEELEALRQQCKYVYVDILRSRLEEVTFVTPPESPFQVREKVPSLGGVHAADTVSNLSASMIQRFVEGAQYGTSIDIQMARDGVSECVANVMRNPDSMFLMTQMREKGELLGQHALNTCVYAIILGRLANFESKQLEDLGVCGLLHDIGKISIPKEILNKTGPLSADELAVLRQHPEHGRDILASGSKVHDSCIEVAYGHHEHLDGSGYPRGIKRAELGLKCRIVAVVEKYDALVNPRYHRPAHTHLDAIRMLSEMAKQNQLDEKVVTTFVSYLGIYPPGSIVELNSGEKAIVIQTNPTQRLLPRILVVRDADQSPVARFVDMALLKSDSERQKYKIKTIHRSHAFGIKLRDYRSAVRSLL